ncbi:MAG: asparagine synthase, partial [Rhodospirillaceae bacterium]|nr:asparagine synthase [Rhodospirillaceae bacterium]
RRNALPAAGPVKTEAPAALKQLDDTLNDSVGVHQRSDVPYGMFFSGGIDSSVLLAMMTRLNDRPVKALTAGFSGTSAHDERQHARLVATASGADHIEVDFTEDDFWTLLPKVAAAVDDATADYAVLPTYKLAARARKEGLKVVLSGEGGDELFAGYGRYRHACRPWPFMRPMRRRGIFDGLDILRNSPAGWRDGIASAETAARLPGRSRLQIAQATDCADWLPADLLGKLDRCLMAHGVEGRVPFLDEAMADFAVGLPDHLKIHRRRGKWLLRRWLETALPEAKPFARKRGFTVPVGEWISRDSVRLAEKLAMQPGIAEICRPGAVESLFKSLHSSSDKHLGKAAWTLLFYGLWHNANILGRPSDANVLDSL